MKKAISVLLILATVLSCCVTFFACKKPKVDPNVNENGTIENTSTVVLNLEDPSKISELGLTQSTEVYDLSGAKQSGKWSMTKTKNILTLPVAEGSLTNAKEVSFWMNSTYKTNINIAVYFVLSDGTEVRTAATVYDLNKSVPDSTTTDQVVVSPGWNEYKLALSETKNLDKSYAYVKPEKEGEEGSIEIRFDRSKIVGIKLDAHNSKFDGTIDLFITSVKANTVKSGTMRGYTIDEIANAVCFVKDSNAYLYNQNRYLICDNEKVGIVSNDNTTMVPVEVLARHRGAEILTSDKDNKTVTFKYKGTNYTFTEGDEIAYVGDERGFVAGESKKVAASSINGYVTIPMEKAAEIFGYHLFFDQMGLAVFSDTDLKQKYLPMLDENYKTDAENGMNAIYNIIQVVIFSTYTGSELIDDMNTIHGENGHTKLIVTQKQFDILKERYKNDPTYAAWLDRFESGYKKGTTPFSRALPQFYLSDGYRLLQQSRDVMEDVLAYAFLYKMTDNDDYAERVKKLLVATTKFNDKDFSKQGSWHPEHFLDTGELMFAFGIGYDWCYDYLAKDKKTLATLEDGIWRLGYGAAMGFGDLYNWWDDKTNLEKYNKEMLDDGDPETGPYLGYKLPGRVFYINTGKSTYEFKFDRYNWTNNWNAVCTGGMTVMALAFANVNVQFRAASQYLLDCITFTFPAGLYEGYGPDGGYPEGPGYWGYGTNYSINMISAVASACGTDLGYTKAPGFRESFYFITGTASTTRGCWGYHDGGRGQPSGDRFYWFAYQCGDTNIAAYRYNQINTGKTGVGYWDLMFYDPANIAPSVELDLDVCYYGIGVTTFRSDWTDQAIFAGLHGGANAASHGQLDVGNFILDCGDTQFFIDFGADNYNLTGYSANGSVTYFSNPYRYWYYKMRAEGHNTLVINPTRVNTGNTNMGTQGKNYDSIYAAVSDVLRYESGKTSALSVVDMGCAYLEALDVYYKCPSCGNQTAAMCAGRCAGKNQLVIDDKTGMFKCNASGCTYKVSANCPECGTRYTSHYNGVRGLLFTENRSTVIIQDEMWLNNSYASSNKVLWMGHVDKGAKITIADDGQSALIRLNGKTLLVDIVVPEGYTGKWHFETQAADYLPETGLVMTPGEDSRDGYQKLVAICDGTNEIKLAIVCKLLSSGPHNYTWTDIDDWKAD